MNDQIRLGGQWAWAMVGFIALVSVLAIAAWSVRAIWPPLIFATAIIYLLNPIVTRLQRHHIPRLLGTALTYTAVLALLVLAGFSVAPIAANQANDLADQWPTLRTDVEQWIDDLALDTQDWIIETPTVAEIRAEFANDSSSLSQTIDRARNIGSRVIHGALIIILGPIIAFYLLVDLPRLRLVANSLVPPGRRRETEVVAARLNRAMGGFLRGQLAVALIVGLMVSIGLAIIGLEFWLIVGMIAGLSNVVPLIGPWVGGVPAVVIALSTGDAGQAFWVVIVMIGAQQIDNHFISPLIMRRTVKLHPAVVMLALLAGGSLGGFFGLFLAVPTAAILKIFASHLWRTYVLNEPIDQIATRTLAEDSLPGTGIVSDILDSEYEIVPRTEVRVSLPGDDN